MATRHRKIRKLRGSRTVGYGQVGQHRKSGSQGGHGMAGLHKHKWSWTVKYAKDYYGNHGFNSIHKKVRKWINLDQLDNLSTKQHKQVEGMALVNLSSLGYQKLLGRGKVTNPYLVVVDNVTKSAEKAIKEAGGKVEKQWPPKKQ